MSMSMYGQEVRITQQHVVLDKVMGNDSVGKFAIFPDKPLVADMGDLLSVQFDADGIAVAVCKNGQVVPGQVLRPEPEEVSGWRALFWDFWTEIAFWLGLCDVLGDAIPGAEAKPQWVPQHVARAREKHAKKLEKWHEAWMGKVAQKVQGGKINGE